MLVSSFKINFKYIYCEINVLTLLPIVHVQYVLEAFLK